MIVDIKHDRRTVPTASGKSFPVLFGPGATSLLMYLSLNPGAKLAEIKEALEIDRGQFLVRANRLRRKRIVAGNLRYQINPMVEHETELVRFLRVLGRAYGLPEREKPTLFKAPRRANDKKPGSLPDDLFGTPLRTSLLLLIAALHETYAGEAADVLCNYQSEIGKRMRELAAEGVLKSRVFKRVKLFSLNDDFPGAAELKILLRRMAGVRSDAVAAANAALIRRERVAKEGRSREKRIIENINNELAASGKAIHGVQLVVGKHTVAILDGRSSKSSPFVHPMRRNRRSMVK